MDEVKNVPDSTPASEGAAGGTLQAPPVEIVGPEELEHFDTLGLRLEQIKAICYLMARGTEHENCEEELTAAAQVVNLLADEAKEHASELFDRLKESLS